MVHWLKSLVHVYVCVDLHPTKAEGFGRVREERE
jgi:hypothetical protein